MADEVDRDEERRQYIDAMHARLTSLSHYEALGVARTADAKEITRAYFRLVAIVHPDRHFGKNLGSYTAKLSAVFTRIALAPRASRRSPTRAGSPKTRRSRLSRTLSNAVSYRFMTADVVV